MGTTMLHRDAAGAIYFNDCQRWPSNSDPFAAVNSRDKQDWRFRPNQAEVTPNVLNTINMTSAEKALVKEGLYDVVHGTNTYKTGGDLDTIKPAISAKTGTAQTYYKGHETETLSLASYAPTSHPQVVVALAMPNLSTSDESNNMTLAKKIYAAYWSTVQSKSTVSSSSSSN